VIAENQRLHGFGDAFELNESRRTSFGFGLKELDSTGDDSRVVFEDIHDVVFGDPVGGVEEVQNLCRRRDSVFRGGLRVSEAIVSVAHEVLEGGGRVDEVEGLLHVVEEGLLRVTQLHLMAKECHVIQCTDAALDRHRVSHLNHSTALFALQELDPNHITEETEQIEHSVAIHLFVV